MIILLAILIVCAVAVLSTIYIVPQQKAYVIERLGKYNRISHPGLHVRIPVIEKIVGKIDLRTNQSVLAIDAKTQDNVTITMQVAVQYHVDGTGAGYQMQQSAVAPQGSPVAPGAPVPGSSVQNIGAPQVSVQARNAGIYNAFYILSNPVEQMKAYVADALRSSIPRYTIDEVYDRKDDIANDVQHIIAATMISYGYVVVSTLIVNIELPRDVEAAMNEINTAQRKQVAAQALAEAERIKVVTEAKAQAEAAEQAGIGIANQRKAIAVGINESIREIRESGMTDHEANLLFMFTQWTDMMTQFGQNPSSSTVVLPADFRETSSMFEQMLVANETEDAQAR